MQAMTKGMSFLGVVLVLIIGMGYVASQGVFTKRYWATYQPGDCLRTPAQDADTERWDIREPDTILMVAEVGKENYRTREWGRKFSNFPQWYTNYDIRMFAELDRWGMWSPIPCPEQGPDPEVEAQRIISSTDGNGTVFYVEVDVTGDAQR